MTATTKFFAQAWRDMAHVPRWAILRKNRTQSLAEHSFYVGVYAVHIAQVIAWRGDYAALMMHALYHDIDETVSGDIPGPYKRAAVDKSLGRDVSSRVLSEKFGGAVVSRVNNADEDVKLIVSAADAVDELCYLVEEIRSGNTWVQPVVSEVRVRLKKRWMALPVVQRVREETWREVEPLLWEHQFDKPVLLKDLT